MSRQNVLTILAIIVLISLACSLPVSPLGPEGRKKTYRRYDFTGDRTTFRDEYSCHSTDKTILIIDEDGVATLTTTGPEFVDIINCTLDPSGFETTYVIVGLELQNSTIEFTSCNEGGFDAKGTLLITISAPGSLPVSGTVSCIYTKGDDAGKVRMTLTVNKSKNSP